MRADNPSLFRSILLTIAAISCCVAPAFAATSRITRTVDANRVRAIGNSGHRMAQAQFDRGVVDSGFAMDHVQILFRPSAEQQADLDQLLVDQQNPGSPNFHQWLSPEA